MKKYIPNIITIIRFFLAITFFIIYVFNTEIALIIFIMFILSYILNKYISQKIVIRKYDQKISTVIIRFTVYIAIIISIFKVDRALIITLLLESVITSLKILLLKNNILFTTNLIKVRQILLQIIIIIGMSTEFFPYTVPLFYLLMVLTSLVQIGIIIRYYKNLRTKTVEEA